MGLFYEEIARELNREVFNEADAAAINRGVFMFVGADGRRAFDYLVGLGETVPKKIKLKPLGDRVIVKRIAEMERTASGLYIPPGAADKPQEADVLAVGEKVEAIAVGNRVLLGKYSGNEVELDGEQLVILNAEDVLAVVE